MRSLCFYQQFQLFCGEANITSGLPLLGMSCYCYFQYVLPGAGLCGHISTNVVRKEKSCIQNLKYFFLVITISYYAVVIVTVITVATIVLYYKPYELLLGIFPPFLFFTILIV